VALGRQPIVTPEQARTVMQVYQAADLSAETGLPVDLSFQATVRGRAVSGLRYKRVGQTNRGSLHRKSDRTCPMGARSKPTKTRWWILFLISLMYLICYMDRSNISVAQPEIAKPSD
jgi:hypothetical protein